MEDCCSAENRGSPDAGNCSGCGRRGRSVEEITPKALLRPDALARRNGVELRFCTSADCPVVYFGDGQVFSRKDLIVRVFQKELPGDRIVCYCFAVTEGDVRRGLTSSGRSAEFERISALVKMGRCACEVRNPQGNCCLGNVSSLADDVVRRGVAAGDSVAAP